MLWLLSFSRFLHKDQDITEAHAYLRQVRITNFLFLSSTVLHPLTSPVLHTQSLQIRVNLFSTTQHTSHKHSALTLDFSQQEQPLFPPMCSRRGGSKTNKCSAFRELGAERARSLAGVPSLLWGHCAGSPGDRNKDGSSPKRAGVGFGSVRSRAGSAPAPPFRALHLAETRTHRGTRGHGPDRGTGFIPTDRGTQLTPWDMDTQTRPGGHTAHPRGGTLV